MDCGRSKFRTVNFTEFKEEITESLTTKNLVLADICPACKYKYTDDTQLCPECGAIRPMVVKEVE